MCVCVCVCVCEWVHVYISSTTPQSVTKDQFFLTSFHAKLQTALIYIDSPVRIRDQQTRFSITLTWSKMLQCLSRIWTLIVESISKDIKHYAIGFYSLSTFLKSINFLVLTTHNSYCWLVDCVLWPINLCRLSNAKSIFI